MTGSHSWWRHIRSYRWRSIFLKYALMIFLALLVFILLINLAYFMLYNRTLRDELFVANETTLEKTAAFMDFALRNAENLSANLIVDYEAEYFLNAEGSNAAREYANKDYLTKKMSGLVTGGDYYASIFLYSDARDVLLDTVIGLSTRDHFYDRAWFGHYRENPHTPYAFSQTVDFLPLKMSYHQLTYIIPFNIGAISRRGVVVVNYNLEQLGEIIDSDYGQAESLFIFDRQGQMLYDSDLAYVGMAAVDVPPLAAYLRDALAGQDSFLLTDEEGHRRIASTFVSAKNGWRYISIVPYDLLSAMTRQLRTVVPLTLLGSGLAAILIAFIIAMRVYMPIKSIIDLLDDTQADMARGAPASNEIKLIIANLMNMLDSRKNLEDELTRRLLLLRRAQSVALQTQINPHFLYNTLESINWKALRLSQGENEVSRMIGILSHILSYSLDTENNLVPLGTELAYTERYIMIQRERHKNLFDVEWMVDPSLHEKTVLKLMLQPLVENAMYHGIIPKKQKGRIRIRAAREDEHMRIEVWDNGKGMSPEAVESLNETLQSPMGLQESRRIGLGNVNQRLRIVFGEAYGLRVESVDAYTSVTLLLPLED